MYTDTATERQTDRQVHLADQVGVHQDVSSCQVSVDVAHVREVLHPRCDPPQHPHQLDGGELSIVYLQADRQTDSE